MTTTVLLLVSRDDFLEDIFKSLDELDCDKSNTALLCLVDGDTNLYIKTRNYCEMTKFVERLCIHVKMKQKISRFDIAGRRKRISELHNEARSHLKTRYVFGIEDDTIVPRNALKTLGEQYIDNVGFIQGVELGRWGVPYIGAWEFDDCNNPKIVKSLELAQDTQKIDAGGFYCFLTKTEYYKDHEFKPFENNAFGPDVDFGISLRRKGLINLADFTVKCVHKADNVDITIDNTIARQIRFKKINNRWRQVY